MKNPALNLFLSFSFLSLSLISTISSQAADPIVAPNMAAPGTLNAASLVSTPEKEPALLLKSTVWTQFLYDMPNGAVHKYGFDVTRAYVQGIYEFDSEWSSVFLLDAQRGELTTGTTGSVTKAPLWVYLRNAYVEKKNFADPSLKFRFGIQPTPYIFAVDSQMQTRWLSKNLMDTSGANTSQAAGVSLWGKWPGVEAQVMVHNGAEGIQKTGANDNALDGNIHVGLSPWSDSNEWLKGMILHLEYDVESEATASLPNTPKHTRMAATLTHQTPMGNYALEMLSYIKAGEKAMLGFGVTANLAVVRDRAWIYARYFSGDQNFQSSLLGADKYRLLTGSNIRLFTGKKSSISTALLYELKQKSNARNQAYYWVWMTTF